MGATKPSGASTAVRAVSGLIAAVLIAALVVVAGPVAPAAAGGAPPNIVVVMLDDVRPEQLASMPNTQALIRDQGVDFSTAAVNTPECCPSRSTFFSGQYTHNHGVFNSGSAYGWAAFDEQNTLPLWLDEAGYFTAFTGKYLNGYGSQAPAAVPPGWDDWYAGAGSSTYNYYSAEVFNTDGQVVELPPETYLTDAQNAHMVDLIETHSGTDPMYLHYAPIASHVGLKPPSSLAFPFPADRHAGSMAGTPYPVGPNYNEPDNSDKPARVAAMPQYSTQSLGGLASYWRAAHETVKAVDEGIGDMVQALDDAGQLENTIFVVTSDNGMAYGEHRIWGKFWPYEIAERVPMMMRGPGIPAGIIRDQTVGIVDLTATIVDAADASPSLPLDGISLLPLVADGSLAADRVMAAEAGPPGGATSWRQARRGQQIFTRWESGEREFYDLTTDPYQLENAIDDPAHASVIAELEADLEVLDDCVGAVCRVGLPGYPNTVTQPVVGSVSPAVDIEAGGRTVTVEGNGFTGATAVAFGAVPATAIDVVSDTRIDAVVPPQAAGQVSVTVTTPSGSSAAGLWSDAFDYITAPPTPSIATVSPSAVSTLGGVGVTITGTNFGYVDEVTFDGVAGTSLTVDSPTQVTIVSPPNAIGPADVVVETPWAASGANSITYEDPGAPPTVTKVAPAQGSTLGGTVVTLTGTNFNHVTGVTFSGTQAPSFVVDSPTQIRVTSPAFGAYLVNINVTTWAGTSPSVAYQTWYAYRAPPNIDAISPTQGPTTGGTVVTITGTGFTAATGVTFGGVPAASFTVNSSTQITATTPAYGPYLVTVKVTGPGGVSPSEGWTTFFGFQTPATPPNIDARSPSQGPIAGGTVVTITGTNFTGATQVTFGGKPGTNLQVLSSTQIQVTTPSFSQPYLVAIKVTGPGGVSPSEGWTTLFGYV